MTLERDRRCDAVNPRSTIPDRCERREGHAGDHVSVCHYGKVKIYPSKWTDEEKPRSRERS